MEEEKQLIDEEWSEEGLDFSDEDEVEENAENLGDDDLFFELSGEDSEETAGAGAGKTADTDGKNAEANMGAGAAAEKDAGASDSTADDSMADKNTDAESADASAPGKEKKLFGKKKEKKSQMEARIAELEEQRVRQLAEFENFRKRSEREKSQMFEMGAKDVIEKILPVIDNFERGLMGVPEEQKEEPFVQGMELVYKQILTAFEDLGVQPIEAVGQEFDPGLHNAVMAVDDDSMESGMIAEELQKGYLYKDSVVRHSMVKVVN